MTNPNIGAACDPKGFLDLNNQVLRPEDSAEMSTIKLTTLEAGSP